VSGEVVSRVLFRFTRVLRTWEAGARGRGARHVRGALRGKGYMSAGKSDMSAGKSDMSAGKSILSEGGYQSV